MEVKGYFLDSSLQTGWKANGIGRRKESFFEPSGFGGNPLSPADLLFG
jgi:hypothetical protein